MKPTLVIMAAGIGSRFGGGVKQLSPVGPSGELIIDYSIHDALRAGFGKIVFVIRHDIEADFRAVIGDRISRRCGELGVETRYCFQSLTDLPAGFEPPAGRTKPWGTCQAVLAAREHIREPFAVINADDYYGPEAYRQLYAALSRAPEDDASWLCMAGYRLGNTLSESGAVTRGLCAVDAEGFLTGIRETGGIVSTSAGAEANGEMLDPDTPVSMNMWGMTAPWLKVLARGFEAFLAGGGALDPKAEFLLPVFIGEQLRAGKARVRVLPVNERWYGVTYQQDRPAVEAGIRGLISRGVYGLDLYGDLTEEEKA